ncbi:MAG: Spy/CpxP family protein refolding chaperone [Planctomycetota bacterium]|jgi:Spy/CpxP family protein refolding chaperone
MKGKRVLFVACFLAAFLAGLALHAAVASRTYRRHGRHLPESLGLSEQQAERIHEIYSSAMKESGRLAREGYPRIAEERREAVRALIGDDKIAAYEEILAKEATARDDLGAKRRELLDRAVAESRTLLDEEQKVLYDEFIAERRKRRDRNGNSSHVEKKSPDSPEKKSDENTDI